MHEYNNKTYSCYKIKGDKKKIRIPNISGYGYFSVISDRKLKLLLII